MWMRTVFPAGRAAITGRLHSIYLSETQRAILCDPQTSGGLLVTVEPKAVDEVAAILEGAGLPFNPIGRLSQQLNEKVTLTLSD